jgi:monooxygenase
MMLGDVPNFAFAIGYMNASWTLKCELTCAYVCRLLRHMDEHGYRWCMPDNDDPTIIGRPFIDFSSGYIRPRSTRSRVRDRRRRGACIRTTRATS